MADISADQLDSVNSWVNSWSMGGTWSRGQPADSNHVEYTTSAGSKESQSADVDTAANIRTVSASHETADLISSHSAVYKSSQAILDKLNASDIEISRFIATASSYNPLSLSENSTGSIFLPVSDTAYANLTQDQYANIRAVAFLNEKTASSSVHSAVYKTLQNVLEKISASDIDRSSYIATAGRYEQLELKETTLGGVLVPVSESESSEASHNQSANKKTLSVTSDYQPLKSSESAVYFTRQHITETVSLSDIDSANFIAIAERKEDGNFSDVYYGKSLIPVFNTASAAPENIQSVKLDAVALSISRTYAGELSSVRSDAVSSCLTVADAIDLPKANYATLTGVSEKLFLSEEIIGRNFVERSASDSLDPYSSESVIVNFAPISIEEVPAYESSSVRSDAVSNHIELLKAADGPSAIYDTHSSVIDSPLEFLDDVFSSVIFDGNEWEYTPIRDTVSGSNLIKIDYLDINNAVDTPTAVMNAVVSAYELGNGMDTDFGNINAVARWSSSAVPYEENIGQSIYAGSDKAESNPSDEFSARAFMPVKVREFMDALTLDDATSLMHVGFSDIMRPSDVMAGILHAVSSLEEQAEALDASKRYLDVVASCFDVTNPYDYQSVYALFEAYQEDIADAFDSRDVRMDYVSEVIESGHLAELLTCIHYQFKVCFEQVTASDRCWIMKELDSALWKVIKHRAFNAGSYEKNVWKVGGSRLFEVAEESDTDFKARSERIFKS